MTETVKEFPFEGKPEWPIHITKLHRLPGDFRRALMIRYSCREALIARGREINAVNILEIEDELPFVQTLKSQIANSAVLLFTFF